MSNSKELQAAQQQWAQQFPALAVRGIDEPTWNALKTSIFPGAADDSILMATDYCRARELDVMLKPVHIVPMYVNDKQTNTKGMRDVIMPGIGMYRIQADRTGNYAGADAPVFGPMVEKTFKDKDGNSHTMSFPESVTMTIYKLMPNGARVAYTATEYWEENYATAGRDSEIPNAMWKKRARGQLVKCVEAQCLRRGWPEIGQDVTAEEMEGKTYMRDVTPKADDPKSISQQSEQAADDTPNMPNPFPDEIFQNKFDKWAADIKDGKIIPDSVANFVESKGYQLTTIQRGQLDALMPAE